MRKKGHINEKKRKKKCCVSNVRTECSDENRCNQNSFVLFIKNIKESIWRNGQLNVGSVLTKSSTEPVEIVNQIYSEFINVTS